MIRKRILASILTLCLITGGVRLLPEQWITSPAYAEDSFIYSEDTWSFSSDVLCTGSTPYLTVQLKQALLKNKETDEAARLTEMLSTEKTDLSYGMSVLAFLHYEGIWNAAEINNNAGVLNDIPEPYRKDVFYSWLNYYDMLQYTDDIVTLDEAAISAGGTADAAAQAAESGSPAVMRLYSSAESSALTVLIYGSESGSWTFDDNEYDSRILVANPENTAFDEDDCLYYNSIDSSWTVPGMDLSSESGGLIGAVISDTDLLNAYGYDPSSLPALHLNTAFAYPDENDILISPTQTGFPAVMGASIDIDFSEAADAVLDLGYDEYSADAGIAFPFSSFSCVINEPDMIYTSVISMNATSARKCSEDTPIVTYYLKTADRETVIAAAREYSIPLQTDPEYGEYYEFPIIFKTTGKSTYYVDDYEREEFPLTMTGSVCIVITPKKTTTTTTKTTTTTTTTSTTTSTTTTKKITSTTTTTTEKITTTSSEVTAVSTTPSPTTTPSKTTSSVSSKVSSKTTASAAVTTTASSADITTQKTTATTTKATTTTAPPTTTTTTVSTTTTTVTRNSFIWGTDNWSVSHNMLALKYISNGYGLLEDHEENLNAALSPMERVRIQQVLENLWLGSEYGTAVTEILAKSGIFPVSMWDPSVNSVYELDLNDERNLSLISYYQLLQENDIVQQQIAWTSTYMNQKSVLSDLITLAKKSGSGEDMVLACVFSKSYAHSVIAYDVAYGAWNLNGNFYDGRILTSDPYLDDFSDDACIYFNSTTLDWCIPMWNLSSSDSSCFIGLASNSLSLMNNAGYFMGTSSAQSDHEFVPILEIPADIKDFLITPIGDENEASFDSSELNWFSTVASYVSHKRAGLSYQAEGFEMYPQDANTVSYQISFEDFLISVQADNAEKISMTADGTASISGSQSAYELSITSESNLMWDRITLTGSGCSILNVSHDRGSIIITGDCLAGMTVVADDLETAVSKKLSALSDGRIYSTAQIYPDADGNIQVLADLDGDGKCETLLTDDQPEESEIRYGDVNLDSDISLLDVVALNRYVAGSVMLNEEALANADCDESLRINALDVTLILQYVVEAVPALPLSKAQEILNGTE